MKKSEVYSWRLSPLIKDTLEECARGTGQSVGSLLEGIVTDWLQRGDRKRMRNEQKEGERIRARALRYVGAIAGGNRRRSENARKSIRARLKSRHAR
jgi:hypothetical protein